MKTNEINYSTLSLRGLRTILPSTTGNETPSETWFRENPGKMIFSECCGEGTITVYSNGFYTYTEDDGEHLSILRVDGFKRLRYDFADNTQSIVEESEYLDSSFLVALYINGKNQWDRNTLKRSAYRHEYYLENDSSDWGEEAMVPSAEEEFFDKENKLDELKRLNEALFSLTDRQKEIIKMYFFEKLSQGSIAALTNLSRRTVRDHIICAIKKIKNFFPEHTAIDPLFFGDY